MIYFFAILAFSGLLFEAFQPGVAIQKSILLALLFLALTASPRLKYLKSSIYLVLPFILFLVYSAISAFWLSGSLPYVITLLTPLLVGPLLYIYLVGLSPSSIQLPMVKKFFLVICILQILIAFTKFIVHGIDEKVLIGSMSNNAGQLGFLFPSLAIPIIFYFYMGRNEMLMWLLVLGQAFFALINEKRSIVFLFPLIIFFSIRANSPYSNYNLKAGRLVLYAVAILASILTVSIGVAVIPSLSNSSSLAGAGTYFAPIQYAFDYLTMDYGGNLQGTYQEALHDENIQVGRFILTSSIFNWFLKSDISIKLFGLGYGVATPSEWIGQQVNPLFSILGTRGAISAAGLALIETGLIGFSLISLFFINFYCSLRNAINASRYIPAYCWYRTLEVLFFVMLYDYYFYSTLLVRTLPMPFILFCLISTIPVQGRRNSLQIN